MTTPAVYSDFNSMADDKGDAAVPVTPIIISDSERSVNDEDDAEVPNSPIVISDDEPFDPPRAEDKAKGNTTKNQQSKKC